VLFEKHLQGSGVGCRGGRGGGGAQRVDECGEATVLGDQTLDQQAGLGNAVGGRVEHGLLGVRVRQERGAGP